MIEVSNLTKKYGNITAVDDISFHVKQGEVIGFLGPNGAGKSTTMKILSCFIPATSGRVSVGGFDILDESLKIREIIGYLPENNPLYSEVNVSEYLSFICDIRKLPRTVKLSSIGRVVEKCGLRSVLKKEIAELSRGFRQRVGLAQSLIHDPSILILDEPTSGLDPNQVVEIRELIKTLGEEKTIMISTHILPEVSATCGRIIIINDGKIAACDTPEKLQNKIHKSTIIANIRGPERGVKKKISAIKAVISVEKIANSESFCVSADKSIDSNEGNISEQVFDVVVENGWKLRELRWENLSLEEIFHKLTMVEKQ